VSGDLGWRADGIARARDAGGVELELYRRPGFAGGTGVRRSNVGGSASGFSAGSVWQDEFEVDPTPEMHVRKKRG
jgi:hypothetical protein